MSHAQKLLEQMRDALRLIANLNGTYKLLAQILYGSGLRLTEGIRLRIKDVDFEYQTITVRDGKGEKDVRTTTPFPNLWLGGALGVIYTHVLNRGGLAVRSPLDV